MCVCFFIAATNRGNPSGSSQTGDALGKALASVGYNPVLLSILHLSGENIRMAVKIRAHIQFMCACV